MRKIHLKLYMKITLLIISLVTISLYTAMYFATQQMISNIESEMENNILNVAHVLANSPIVIDGIQNGTYFDNEIQPYVQKILNATNQVEIIVVADMNGIRFAHPNPDRLGERFVGGDEIRVLETGETYISQALGTLGDAKRAFVPIYDASKQKQLGFVMVGNLTQTIVNIQNRNIKTNLLISTIGLLLGIVGAIVLTKNIKKSLLGLEPQEISKLYTEKRGMLGAIHEGIIAIDDKLQITLINDSAIALLNIKESNLVGKKVLDVFPNSKLPEVFYSGLEEFNREEVINNTFIITNRVPIKSGDKIVGAVASFRDKTMITRLAEEVTGVKQIVSALRANTHEFMNKLHVILGLIDIGDLDEAKEYIVSVKSSQEQIMNLIVDKIKDPTIIGLLIGKFSRAKELGISMSIEEDSCLEKRDSGITSNTLVTIIGNLVENAMESVSLCASDKRIWIRIYEDYKSITVEIGDSGMGIKSETMNHIFERGYSTKDDNRGVGLALVKEIVENLGGHIKVESKQDSFTKFTVILPKGV